MKQNEETPKKSPKCKCFLLTLEGKYMHAIDKDGTGGEEVRLRSTVDDHGHDELGQDRKGIL